jgi:hypothetical protein
VKTLSISAGGSSALGGGPADETPVPGLVGDAVGVVSRVSQTKAEAVGVRFQPGKLGGRGERFPEIVVVRRPDIDGPPAMVLAEARVGREREDFRPSDAGGDFRLEQLALAGDAAKPGDGHEHDSRFRRALAHAYPGPGRRGCQESFPP